jgi:hypothetical protein
MNNTLLLSSDSARLPWLDAQQLLPDSMKSNTKNTCRLENEIELDPKQWRGKQ